MNKKTPLNGKYHDLTPIVIHQGFILIWSVDAAEAKAEAYSHVHATEFYIV